MDICIYIYLCINIYIYTYKYIYINRVAYQKETAEAGAALRQKGRDIELEGRRLQDERNIQLEKDAIDRRKLEVDRADFAVHVAGSARAVETGTNHRPYR
jgi:hypothetical protein